MNIDEKQPGLRVTEGRRWIKEIFVKGYGYVTPVSPFSRLLVVVYGMIGIPLALVTMADAGKFLSQFVTQCFQEVSNSYNVQFIALNNCTQF